MKEKIIRDNMDIMQKMTSIDPEQANDIAQGIVKKMKENKDMTLQEAAGIPDELLEQLYTLAHGHYTHGKYNESVSIFFLLASMAPMVYKYVLGLAASHHQLKRYEDAANGFYIAQLLEPENPIPSYYLIDCYMKLEMYEKVQAFIEITIEQSAEDEKYKQLHERVILIRKTLEEKLNKNNLNNN